MLIQFHINLNHHRFCTRTAVLTIIQTFHCAVPSFHIELSLERQQELRLANAGPCPSLSHGITYSCPLQLSQRSSDTATWHPSFASPQSPAAAEPSYCHESTLINADSMAAIDFETDATSLRHCSGGVAADSEARVLEQKRCFHSDVPSFHIELSIEHWLP